jgi:hypothetical protein
MRKSKTPPSPSRIDKLCENLQFHKRESVALAEILLALAKRSGTPRGEKSKALLGLLFEAVRTDGHSTKIDDHAVAIFRAKLKAAGAVHLFKRLFVYESRFVLAPGYEDVLKQVAPGPPNLATMFYSCVSITPKSPSLSVRPLKNEKSAKKAKAAA